MSRARRSLRDRDEFAYAADTEPDQVPAEAPSADAAIGRKTAASSPTRRPAIKGRDTTGSEASPRTHSATTRRIGIYFRPGQFEAAKAAYLADWNHLLDSPDTFALWIAATLERHSALSPTQRAEVAVEVFHAEPGERGLTRSFNVPESTVATMRKAIGADRAAGLWGSQSEFCGVAIAATTETARQRVGGTLPPAPARLPNRLIR